MYSIREEICVWQGAQRQQGECHGIFHIRWSRWAHYLPRKHDRCTTKKIDQDRFVANCKKVFSNRNVVIFISTSSQLHPFRRRLSGDNVFLTCVSSRFDCFNVQDINFTTLSKRLFFECFLCVFDWYRWHLHDNDKKFKSKVVSRYCHDAGINNIDFPSYSPDLNPIENLWAGHIKGTCWKQLPEDRWRADWRYWARMEAHWKIALCSSCPKYDQTMPSGYKQHRGQNKLWINRLQRFKSCELMISQFSLSVATNFVHDCTGRTCN